ncbi:regulatory signaling modulator protein AmpE [Marinimicrobium alkaliphilum]|uniref:regulatory signaling modulator protein AmpE n=1 Tax=Marinimicrobium alkaliphilum TaxID=2202654 RepID=UPI000DBAB58F|nr:regulatory signaling modulator protein AmpE [Marinimicrobium alkaliphilum]
MIFLTVIVVLALVQFWGSGAPLQKDGWFVMLQERLKTLPVVDGWPALHLALSLAIPLLVLGLVIGLIGALFSPFWAILVYVPVLLYSLGRGDFSADIKAYLVASRREDSVAAVTALDQLRGGAGHERDELDSDDWPSLHAEALRVIGYRGFERMFAVIFWFFIFGPVGALLYRLSVLYREQEANTDLLLARRWLWLVEWPAVRVLGLTWALVGDFDLCIKRWQRSLTDFSSTSMAVLATCLSGALGRAEQPAAAGPETVPAQDDESEESEVDDEVPVGEPKPYSRTMIKVTQALFSRSLLLWVSLVALVTLLV